MTKRMNKRMLIIIAVLLFLVIVVILGSTMFNLKNVEVYITNRTQANAVKEEDVRTSCNLYLGKNLLFLSGKKAEESVQKGNVYAKDIRVERKFPNTLSVTLSERQELFAIKLKEDSGEELYYMYDLDGMALRTDRFNNNNANISAKSENIRIEGITKEDLSSNRIGSRIQLYDPAKINFVTSVFDELLNLRFAGSGEEPLYNERTVREVFSVIDVSDLRTGGLLTTRKTGGEGVTILFANPGKDIQNQIFLAVATLRKWQIDEVDKTRSGYMKIYYREQDGKYTATWAETL